MWARLSNRAVGRAKRLTITVKFEFVEFSHRDRVRSLFFFFFRPSAERASTRLTCPALYHVYFGDYSRDTPLHTSLEREKKVLKKGSRRSHTREQKLTFHRPYFPPGPRSIHGTHTNVVLFVCRTHVVDREYFRELSHLRCVCAITSLFSRVRYLYTVYLPPLLRAIKCFLNLRLH